MGVGGSVAGQPATYAGQDPARTPRAMAPCTRRRGPSLELWLLGGHSPAPGLPAGPRSLHRWPRGAILPGASWGVGQGAAGQE